MVDTTGSSMPLEILIKEEKFIEEDSDCSQNDVKDESYDKVLDFYSEMDSEEKLIELVRNHGELYDTSHRKYMDINKKAVIWQKIAAECGYESVAAAKEAWKRLRDCYRSSLKRKRKTKPSGSGGAPTPKWKHEQLMQFLQPYMKDRVPKSATLEQSVTSPSSQQASSATSPVESSAPLEEEYLDESTKEPQGPIKKKKKDSYVLRFLREEKANREERRKEREEMQMHLLQPEDSLKVFFDSMYISTKQLPPHLQRDVKRQLFNIVLEAEETAATENR